MSCTGNSGCTCGCCSGTSVLTPQLETNFPGLPAIAYRAGSWATFKESMLARLSSSDYPALQALKTRDDDDFSIAFLDATAVVLDILTFYQERLANESYLRTAVQLRSLVELSRLIGYQPAPGVAAATYVAFTLKAAPGLTPDPSAPAITIPQGTQMQSVPAQGQKPQIFETSMDIPAKSDWNALPVQSGQPWIPPGSSSVYLAGTSTQLVLGDSLLILGVARETWTPPSVLSEQWDVVVINQIVVDNVRQLTYVAWDTRLTHKTGGGTSGSPSTWTTAKVFALRQKAALFGNNAPNPNLFVDLVASPITTSLPNLINTSWQWIHYTIASSEQIDLDATYKKVVVNGWFALTMSGMAQLYKVKKATSVSLANFGLSAKVTQLAADFADLSIGDFGLQSTEVWAQSDQLTVPQQPLLYPLYGTTIDLQDLRPDLAEATVVAVSGNRQKLSVNVPGLQFILDADGSSETLNPGDLLTLTNPAPLLSVTSGQWGSGSGTLILSAEDASGRPGTVQADVTDFILAPSSSSDPEISECAVVLTVTSVTDPYPHTQITLPPHSPLLNCYDRQTATVNVNVVMATNGQSVSEVMGSGKASTPNQSFTLKQSPLTYVQAATATGRQSTLQVQVSGVDWTEVPTLYEQSPAAQVFATLNQSDATTDVIFGDGVEGATLPTGQNNLQANYRIGSGSAGNVGASTITTLVDRPLGVSGVTNPQSATGGQDAQSVDDIRGNAPQTVLTLGRAVSITDYQSFAATFAGIAKAYAIWIPSGPGRGVFLTVAGVNGEALPASNATLGYLIAALKSYGNPLIPVNVASFLETLFSISADVQYDPAYTQPTVQAQILQTLSETYSFANRTFGQGVSADEVATVIQGVPGVIAVNVTALTPGATSAAGDLASQGGAFTVAELNNWLTQQISPPLPRPASDPTRICPYLPIPSLTALPLPAEILVLDPDPSAVKLGVMS